MKKYALMLAVIFGLLAPAIGHSENAPAAGGSPEANKGAMMKENHEKKFEEHKAQALERMNKHLAKVQERISCVQAAANLEAIKACRPEGFEGPHHGKRMMGGPGGEHGGPNGGEKK